jgi:putative membrane protein
MKDYISLFLKGLGMGAANVIPGVSGGTIALITGIFERLINAIKSFNLKALKLLIKGDFKALIRHTDLYFLISVLTGIAISILSLAHVLDFLFKNYPVYIWSFFFGLILASVYFVGRSINKWNVPVIISFIAGTVIAVSISVLSPASEDTSMLYLFICGIVAACSMILPGLSGSFVLILMGNYQLVMIDAVNSLNVKVLLPVVVGAGVGLLGFSYILSWVFQRFRNQTIAILTGFILGSLGILWPWKNEIYKTNDLGELIVKSGGEKVVEGYKWFIPSTFNHEVMLAIVFVLTGIIIIWMLEKLAAQKENE